MWCWSTVGLEGKLEVGQLLLQVCRQPMPLQPHDEAHLTIAGQMSIVATVS